MGKIIKKEKVLCDMVKDITCDCCGRSCIDRIGMNYEFSWLSASWGYGSRKDDTQWNFYLCELCSDRVMEFIEKKKEEGCEG